MHGFYKTMIPWNKIYHATGIRLAVLLTALVLSNIIVWILGVITSYNNPALLGLVTIAYGLGLRHAVDADHIAAIDNTTRKFVTSGEKPISVGLFFSLGHSTIVILLSFLIALSSSYIKHFFPTLESIGFVIGTSVSSLFLLLIGIINLLSLFAMLRITKKELQCTKQGVNISISGPYAKLFKKFFGVVSKSWHMYFVGFLFGLGFDTATEVGLLSLSALNGASAVSFWSILLLPLAFTAGMSLVDTLDGVMMLGAYGWAYIKPSRKLYYNLHITLLSVIVAFVIGGMQIFAVFVSAFHTNNTLSTFISAVDFGKVGSFIIFAFIASWIISWSIFKFKRYDEVS